MDKQPRKDPFENMRPLVVAIPSVAIGICIVLIFSSARRPLPVGMGSNGRPLSFVLHGLHPGGPTGIHACGAGATTTLPTLV